MNYKIVGMTIIIVAVLYLIYQSVIAKKHTKGQRWVAIIIAALGITVMLIDRIAEITVKDWFSIKTFRENAKSDADAVAAIRKQVEKQAENIADVAKEANQAKELGKELGAARDFTICMLGAESDNRSDFDKLIQVANQHTNNYSDVAVHALITISDSLALDLNFNSADFSHHPMMPDWKLMNFDPNKATVADYSKKLDDIDKGKVQAQLLFAFSQRSDFSRTEKFQLYLDYMKNTKSVAVLWAICVIVEPEAQKHLTVGNYANYGMWIESELKHQR